jgi:hypothetical protein
MAPWPLNGNCRVCSRRVDLFGCTLAPAINERVYKVVSGRRSSVSRVCLVLARRCPNVFWSVLLCRCRLHRSYLPRPCLYRGKPDTQTTFAALVSSYGFDALRSDGLCAYTIFWEAFGKYCSPRRGPAAKLRRVSSENLRVRGYVRWDDCDDQDVEMTKLTVILACVSTG